MQKLPWWFYLLKLLHQIEEGTDLNNLESQSPLYDPYTGSPLLLSIIPLGAFKRKWKIFKLKQAIKKDLLNKENYENLEDIYLEDKYIDTSSFKSVINLYKKALDLNFAKIDRARMCNKIGRLYKLMAKDEDSKAFFMESMKILEDVQGEDEEILYLRFFNYNHLYFLCNNDEKFLNLAIECSEKLIQLFPNFKEKFNLHLGLSTLYSESKQYDKAINSASGLIYLAQNYFDKAEAYQNLGAVYQENKMFQKAEECFLKSLEIYQHEKDKRFFSKLYFDLGELYFRKGELEKGKDMFKKSLKLKKYAPWLKDDSNFEQNIKDYLAQS